MKCLTIQRGAKPMRVANYSAEHGCTSGCLLCLSEACNQPVDPEQKRDVKGDSWFGHVHLADNFGQQGILAMLQIKAGRALYPAKFMEEKLKEAPGGCWITMKGKGPRGTDLPAIEYKYNSKRVLKFVATSDDGSTKAGTPYDMKFVTHTTMFVFVKSIDLQSFHNSLTIQTALTVIIMSVSLSLLWRSVGSHMIYSFISILH
jgi:hypothetical protein